MQNAKEKKQNNLLAFRYWVIPIVLFLLLIIISYFPNFIEKYYSTKFYLFFSKTQRAIFGKINFSIGDIIYASFLIFFILNIFKFIYFIVTGAWRKNIVPFLLKGIRKLLWLIIFFQIFWGLNYYRTGIAQQLNIERDDYTKQDVELLICDIVQKLNTIRPLLNDSLPQPSFQQIFNEAVLLYDSAQTTYPFLNYTNAAVKKSMFSNISHYIGFTGYYNPFTGEAQLSTDIPKILAPYIVCHEIAHQLGYAQEDEANFVGYLVCSKSNNVYFQYSVYVDLYKYAANELLMMNEKNIHYWELNKLVKKDLKDIRQYFLSKKNSIEPMMSAIYSQYLKANNQSKGLKSYNDVIGLLINKKKKYQRI